MSRDLALVDAGVAGLYVLDLQGPVLVVLEVPGLEALVARVCRQADGQ